MSIPQTCDAVGISPTQFRNWRKHYRDFQDMIRRAEAEAVKNSLAVIHAAAGRSWQAAAWFLERRHPEQWGRVETLSLQTKREAIREAVEIQAGTGRTAAQLKELRTILSLPKDADAETVEAAIEHAKDQVTARKMAEIMGMPFTPKPFPGLPEKSGLGMSAATLARVDKLMLGGTQPTRAERIAALIEIHAKAREVAGKPPLSPADAFEMAARELDGGKTGEDSRHP
jgi:hypothetical protein